MKSYADPVPIGEVMVGGTVGTVVDSKHRRYRPGDVIVGDWGWQEYALSDGKQVQRFDTSLTPISTALGVLGMPGLTAYFGLLDIGQPKPGETVFVSGAAGAVGSVVGQIAKIKGCHVVGSAGSQAKVNHLLTDLGFDAAFDYKQVTDYAAKLQEVCPQGIDVYFDNVGGSLTDAHKAESAEAQALILGNLSVRWDLLARAAKGPLVWKAIARQTSRTSAASMTPCSASWRRS